MQSAAIFSGCPASVQRSQALNHTHFRSGYTSQHPFPPLPPQAPLRMCFGHWDSGQRNATCWIAQSPATPTFEQKGFNWVLKQLYRKHAGGSAAEQTGDRIEGTELRVFLISQSPFYYVQVK